MFYFLALQTKWYKIYDLEIGLSLSNGAALSKKFLPGSNKVNGTEFPTNLDVCTYHLADENSVKSSFWPIRLHDNKLDKIS